MDVYAEVAALKRTRVFRTELSSLDVNETTLPLIKYSRGLQRHLELANMEVVTENKLYDTYASEDGSLGLDGSGRSLSLALKTKKCMYFG